MTAKLPHGFYIYYAVKAEPSLGLQARYMACLRSNIDQSSNPITYNYKLPYVILHGEMPVPVFSAQDKKIYVLYGPFSHVFSAVMPKQVAEFSQYLRPDSEQVISVDGVKDVLAGEPSGVYISNDKSGFNQSFHVFHSYAGSVMWSRYRRFGALEKTITFGSGGYGATVPPTPIDVLPMIIWNDLTLRFTRAINLDHQSFLPSRDTGILIDGRPGAAYIGENTWIVFFNINGNLGCVYVRHSNTGLSYSNPKNISRGGNNIRIYGSPSVALEPGDDRVYVFYQLKSDDEKYDRRLVALILKYNSPDNTTQEIGFNVAPGVPFVFTDDFDSVNVIWVPEN